MMEMFFSTILNPFKRRRLEREYSEYLCMRGQRRAMLRKLNQNQETDSKTE